MRMEHTDDALIVAAVNEREHLREQLAATVSEALAIREERDRLRDIVRSIEEEMERCHRRDGGISQELMDAIYEASAAIGEEDAR